ncbi:Plasmodium vivax Vir protein, putative [Plasmodium vivax]|uniref:Vir protein, putative n=1 Tax=Plasmodium vivax TaxID=5855 RepID=A0A1G4E6M7_PLAVI|nr:Plasmodium vivax Vir protein, putative [Plasmodium vivax]
MAQKTPQPNLAFEKSSEYLKLNTLYEEFFKKDEKINIDNRCNNLNNPNGNDKDVRELCSKVVSYLEKIPMVSDTRKRNNYCSYLPYWFYDEIGRIHKDHSKKMDDIPIFKDIMGVANKKNVKLKKMAVVVVHFLIYFGVVHHLEHLQIEVAHQFKHQQGLQLQKLKCLEMLKIHHLVVYQRIKV